MRLDPIRAARAARSAPRRAVAALAVVAVLLSAAWAQGEDDVLPLHDFADGAPSGSDAAGNGIGFVTWQDGASTLELSVEAIAPGSDASLPDQAEPVSAFRVAHAISSWGGFTHAFADEAVTRWEPRDLSAYRGVRFWYRGDGRGGTVQFDLFDNRDPDLTGDSAERFAYHFVDDTPEWRRIEIPFDELVRRTDFQPGGAPDDGLTLSQTWGWALGFPPGEGVSLVHGVEAYGSTGRPAADAVGVQFASPVFALPESGEVEVRLELSRASEEAVTVRVFVQGDEAESMRDIVARSERVVFLPGETETGIAVRAIDDGRFEGDERASLSLGTPMGAELGFQRRAILVIVDDDEPVAGLIADFESDVGPVSSEDAELSVAELLAGTAAARPQQERFERVLVADAAGAPFRLDADLAYQQDWRGDDRLSFWFHGRGDGRDVTVTILDDVAEPGWEPFFADEFDAAAGASPDWSVWTAEIGDGTANGISGWGNAELQAYTDRPDNVAHDGDGHLVITARPSGGDAPECYYGGPCTYTSARLITRGAVEFTHGRVEARMKLPIGAGLWPALWLLGANIVEVPWPASGEIDIMENVGSEPSTVLGTVHGPGYSGGDAIGRSFRLPADERFADAFHAFALEWRAGELRWYVDDVLFSTVTPADLPRGAPWVFDHPFFVILNVAVGGNLPGPPDATTRFPQSLAVDYVRVFQRADVAERFEARFVDDVAGWRRVEVPFEAFARAAEQPEGAPDDGLGLERVAGLSLAFGPGGPVRLDDLRVRAD